MSPEEAIRVLDQATAQISTNRENHALIQNAIVTLQNYVIEHSENENDSAKEEDAKK